MHATTTRFFLLIGILLIQLFAFNLQALTTSPEQDDFEKEFELGFNDAPLAREIDHPSWFKESFLDLRDDLQEALDSGKKGVALYFGQKNCAYCKALMEINLKKPDIVNYVTENYEIIPLDIWGSRTVTLFDGTEITESKLATQQKTNFTPSLIFYDEQGNIAFKMRGYYSPYRFQAAMKYIVEDFYKTESFRDYLERANPPPRFAEDDLNEHEQFLKGPMILDRRAKKSVKPLAVIFEQRQCHACDQLHSEPLNNSETKQWLEGFELRQLDAWSDTPVITPSGEKTSARTWASDLGIHYMPTTVFFDEAGNEILRIDSVIKLYRMRSVLSYILTEGYKNYKTFQHWRRYTSVER
jgi:thioredoxin-related protein